MIRANVLVWGSLKGSRREILRRRKNGITRRRKWKIKRRIKKRIIGRRNRRIGPNEEDEEI